jgi:hypothetical protein
MGVAGALSDEEGLSSGTEVDEGGAAPTVQPAIMIARATKTVP